MKMNKTYLILAQILYSVAAIIIIPEDLSMLLWNRVIFSDLEVIFLHFLFSTQHYLECPFLHVELPLICCNQLEKSLFTGHDFWVLFQNLPKLSKEKLMCQNYELHMIKEIKNLLVVLNIGWR